MNAIIQIGWLVVALLCVLGVVVLAVLVLPLFLVCALPVVIAAVAWTMWRGV